MRPIALALAGCALLSLAGERAAADREETLAAMAPLLAHGDPELEAWINDRSGRPVELGGPVVLHFRARRPVNLIAVYLDAHGALRLLSPARDPPPGRLAAGVEKQLEFVASEPTGVETLVAIAADQAYDAARLLGRPPAEEFPLVDPDDAPDFARRLTELLGGG